MTFEVGQLADRLTDGYYAHLAALEVAAHPRAVELAPPITGEQRVPVGVVPRRHGGEHAFHFTYYLRRGTAPELVEDFKRVWLVGGLLTLGDALEREGYFDHAPEIEMIYHLRNGVAHGNRFNITARGRERLADYPAHTRQAAIRGDHPHSFEITTSLNGRSVLFDYMDAADVLDLFKSVAIYLLRVADGQPGHSTA